MVCVVNVTPRPLHPRERAPVPIDRRLGGPQGRPRQNLSLIIIIIIHLLSYNVVTIKNEKKNSWNLIQYVFGIHLNNFEDKISPLENEM